MGFKEFIATGKGKVITIAVMNLIGRVTMGVLSENPFLKADE